LTAPWCLRQTPGNNLPRQAKGNDNNSFNTINMISISRLAHISGNYDGTSTSLSNIKNQRHLLARVCHYSPCLLLQISNSRMQLSFHATNCQMKWWQNVCAQMPVDGKTVWSGSLPCACAAYSTVKCHPTSQVGCLVARQWPQVSVSRRIDLTVVLDIFATRVNTKVV
jgi:hypothetical protein